MAFKGTLSDLPVVDLLQLLHQAHKSGVLVLRVGEEEARVWYREGNIVDARLKEHAGVEVIVRTSDWVNGEFEFQPGSENGEDKVGMEFHRVLMGALKIRDERKMEEQRRKAELESKAREAGPPPFSQQLREMMTAADHLLHLCLLDKDGTLLGEARNGKAGQENLEGLRVSVHGFLDAYPRPGMKRLLIEDEAGTVALTGCGRDRLFLLVAERGTPLGSVAMTVNRLAARLDEKDMSE